MHLAAKSGRLEAVKYFLLEFPYGVSSRDGYGCTPLHLAVQTPNIEVVSCLLTYGASVTAQDNNQRTPLHLAAKSGRLEAVDMLVTMHGADTSIEDKDGLTPQQLATEFDQTNVTKFFESRLKPQHFCIVL